MTSKKGKAPHWKANPRRQSFHRSTDPGSTNSTGGNPPLRKGPKKDWHHRLVPRIHAWFQSRRGLHPLFQRGAAMCCLGYMTPKQFREEPIKANPRQLPPDQRLRLPMVVDTK